MIKSNLLDWMIFWSLNISINICSIQFRIIIFFFLNIFMRCFLIFEFYLIKAKLIAIETYIQQHSWLLYVSLALQLNRMASREQSTMDNRYYPLAFELHNKCINMVLNDLLHGFNERKFIFPLHSFFIWLIFKKPIKTFGTSKVMTRYLKHTNR